MGLLAAGALRGSFWLLYTMVRRVAGGQAGITSSARSGRAASHPDIILPGWIRRTWLRYRQCRTAIAVEHNLLYRILPRVAT